MDSQDVTEIEEGKIFLDYGPISMVITASVEGNPLTELCREACKTAKDCLGELIVCLDQLKQPWNKVRPETFDGLALMMWKAVQMTGDEKLTPMAAVAGSIADRVANWLIDHGATKAIVNNGGDVAIRLVGEETTKVGIAPQIGYPGFSHVVQLTARDGVGGVATSGIGGRSFSCGILDSATILANSCAVADAFATSLANRSYIPVSAVTQVLAKSIDPCTDIPELPVTLQVGPLTQAEINLSMNQVRLHALKAIRSGKIKRCYTFLQGVSCRFPD